MAERIPPDRMEAWRLFLTAHAHITAALQSELDDAGEIPLTWYDVLVQLSEAGGTLRMQDLAHAVLLSKSGLTRLVDRMCTAGLVLRTADDNDRRGRWVELTVAGQERLRSAAAVHLRGIRRHFSGLLSTAEAAEIRTALERIVADASSGQKF
jgi:DNA-binding MarR family transcriptional regulator